MKPAPRQTRRQILRTAALLCVVPLAPALLTAWLHPRRPAWPVLQAEAVALEPGRLRLAELRSGYPDALWVDARPAADFDADHVLGAVSLTEDDWETGFAALVQTWDGHRAIVVYCGGESCSASEAVARRLRRELGSEKIFVLEGGWEAWRAEAGRAR